MAINYTQSSQQARGLPERAFGAADSLTAVGQGLQGLAAGIGQYRQRQVQSSAASAKLAVDEFLTQELPTFEPDSDPADFFKSVESRIGEIVSEYDKIPQSVRNSLAREMYNSWVGGPRAQKELGRRAMANIQTTLQESLGHLNTLVDSGNVDVDSVRTVYESLKILETEHNSDFLVPTINRALIVAANSAPDSETAKQILDLNPEFPFDTRNQMLSGMREREEKLEQTERRNQAAELHSAYSGLPITEIDKSHLEFVAQHGTTSQQINANRLLEAKNAVDSFVKDSGFPNLNDKGKFSALSRFVANTDNRAAKAWAIQTQSLLNTNAVDMVKEANVLLAKASSPEDIEKADTVFSRAENLLNDPQAERQKFNRSVADARSRVRTSELAREVRLGRDPKGLEDHIRSLTPEQRLQAQSIISEMDKKSTMELIFTPEQLSGYSSSFSATLLMAGRVLSEYSGSPVSANETVQALFGDGGDFNLGPFINLFDPKIAKPQELFSNLNNAHEVGVDLNSLSRAMLMSNDSRHKELGAMFITSSIFGVTTGSGSQFNPTFQQFAEAMATDDSTSSLQGFVGSNNIDAEAMVATNPVVAGILRQELLARTGLHFEDLQVPTELLKRAFLKWHDANHTDSPKNQDQANRRFAQWVNERVEESYFRVGDNHSGWFMRNAGRILSVEQRHIHPHVLYGRRALSDKFHIGTHGRVKIDNSFIRRHTYDMYFSGLSSSQLTRAMEVGVANIFNRSFQKALGVTGETVLSQSAANTLTFDVSRMVLPMSDPVREAIGAEGDELTTEQTIKAFHRMMSGADNTVRLQEVADPVTGDASFMITVFSGGNPARPANWRPIQLKTGQRDLYGNDILVPLTIPAHQIRAHADLDIFSPLNTLATGIEGIEETYIPLFRRVFGPESTRGEVDQDPRFIGNPVAQSYGAQREIKASRLRERIEKMERDGVKSRDGVTLEKLKRDLAKLESE